MLARHPPELRGALRELEDEIAEAVLEAPDPGIPVASQPGS